MRLNARLLGLFGIAIVGSVQAAAPPYPTTEVAYIPGTDDKLYQLKRVTVWSDAGQIQSEQVLCETPWGQPQHSRSSSYMDDGTLAQLEVRDANFDLRWRLRRSGSQWELQAMPSREDRSGSSRKLRLEPKDVPADALLHMLQANRQALADGSMDAIPVVFLPSTRRKVYHVETHTQKTSAGTLLKIELYQRSWFWRRLQERTYIMELESGRFLRYAGPTQCPLPEDYVGDVHVRYQSLSSGGAN
nr:hypothetical protein [Oceanococcus sp. HetDA_MAG_MS8]